MYTDIDEALSSAVVRAVAAERTKPDSHANYHLEDILERADGLSKPSLKVLRTVMWMLYGNDELSAR
jgi:hypothetical protein